MEIVSSEMLEGVKYGFFFCKEQKIYVSPAVKKLAEDDVNMMAEFPCFVMPVDEKGEERYANLQDWITDIIENTEYELFGSK